MRFLVVLLAFLATAKVFGQHILYRSAADDVIVTAYRGRAVEACRKTDEAKNLGLTDKAWNETAASQLSIGRPGLKVYLWQTAHEDWPRKYRNPYLHLSVGREGSGIRCTYDIVAGAADVTRF